MPRGSSFDYKAIDFIEEQKDTKKPFFLYFRLNAPHTLWIPTDEFKGSSTINDYGDFVQMVDNQVGQLLKSLKNNGLEKNTIVIFTSDNGAFWRPEFIEQFNHRSNYSFR